MSPVQHCRKEPIHPIPLRQQGQVSVVMQSKLVLTHHLLHLILVLILKDTASYIHDLTLRAQVLESFEEDLLLELLVVSKPL